MPIYATKNGWRYGPKGSGPRARRKTMHSIHRLKSKLADDVLRKRKRRQ